MLLTFSAPFVCMYTHACMKAYIKDFQEGCGKFALSFNFLCPFGTPICMHLCVCMCVGESVCNFTCEEKCEN